MITQLHDCILERERKSAEGTGSLDWRPDPPKEGGGSIHGQTNPTHRILVADDEPEIRQLNAAVLIDAGYIVNAVEDGLLAWEALRHDHYNLLITDNEMPCMSGLRLLEKLHRNRICVPVIMATGTMPPAEFILQPWFSDITVLLKPYPLSELLAAVKMALKLPLSGPVV
jgi:CheY-like chemotaxis protein